MVTRTTVYFVPATKPVNVDVLVARPRTVVSVPCLSRSLILYSVTSPDTGASHRTVSELTVRDLASSLVAMPGSKEIQQIHKNVYQIQRPP